MRRSFLIFFLTLVSVVTYGQNGEPALVKDSEFKINSIGAPELVIDLKMAVPEGYALDDESFFDINQGVTATLNSKKYSELIDQDLVTVQISPTANNSIRFYITGFSQKLSELIAKDDAGIYVSTNKAVQFNAFKDSNTLKYNLSVADIEKYTANKIVLTDAMEQELIAAKGGTIFMVDNNMDFGVVPPEESESSQTEFFLSFKYRKQYTFLEETPIFFYGEGLLTTNSKDTLNYFLLYPLNYNLAKGKNEIVGQLGVEGNQRLTSYRISGNAYWQGIIPNLIDLTFGEDRLRLKPVIKLGIKFYQEIENNRIIETDEEFSNQVFGEFYYYIPIKKIYSLILEGNAFYDFNESVNPDEEFKYNVTATLGIDIPKTDFKTIFKYTNGENGITYMKDDMLMLGFMVDLFKTN